MFKLKQIKKIPTNNQAGFTIIESLMAIIVISILMVGIAPVLALSVANRVQARRVELGAIAAKSYLDGVRTGSVGPPPINTTTVTLDTIPAPGSSLPTCDNTKENIVRTPTNIADDPRDIYYCNTTTGATFYLYCVNGTPNDNECTNDNFKDMIVQVFGYNPAITDSDKGYLLGIRVYRADAFVADKTLQTAGADDAKVASANTSGTGLRDNVAPLVEMTTEVTAGDTDLADLCKLKGGSSCN